MSKNEKFIKELSKINSTDDYAKLIKKFGINYLASIKQSRILLEKVKTDPADVNMITEYGNKT